MVPSKRLTLLRCVVTVCIVDHHNRGTRELGTPRPLEGPLKTTIKSTTMFLNSEQTYNRLA